MGQLVKAFKTYSPVILDGMSEKFPGSEVVIIKSGGDGEAPSLFETRYIW